VSQAIATIASVACNYSAYTFFNDKQGIALAMHAYLNHKFTTQLYAQVPPPAVLHAAPPPAVGATTSRGHTLHHPHPCVGAHPSMAVPAAPPTSLVRPCVCDWYAADGVRRPHCALSLRPFHGVALTESLSYCAPLLTVTLSPSLTVPPSSL
jgi:hypothetical protein